MKAYFAESRRASGREPDEGKVLARTLFSSGLRLDARHRTGLTHVEVAVVIVLIVLLIGIAIPTVSRVRVHEERTRTINNLKQMSLCLHAGSDVYKGRLPPAFDNMAIIKVPASLHVHLLPYIEQEPLFKLIASSGRVPTDVTVLPFLASIDRSSATTHNIQNFAANLRVFAKKGVDTKYDESMPELGPIEPGGSAIPRTFTDGTSNTIVFTSKLARCGDGGSHFAAAPNTPFAAFVGQNAAKTSGNNADPDVTFQTAPYGPECRTSPLTAQTFCQVGLFVGLGDGSVRVLVPNMSPETWNRAMQPNDSLALGSDW